MDGMLNIAVRAARAAGALIIRHVDRVDAIEVTAKGMNDFVSAVDKGAEQIIIDTIRRAYPAHGFIAEESGVDNESAEYCWIIDPLDGTTNFLHGFPQYAVSIAVARRGRVEYGVVFDPLRQEQFTASRGSGARLNDRRIRVSRQSGLNGALLGTGFPFRSADDIKPYLKTFEALAPVTAGIRRAGAAALDLAYVAAGRLDGFWEFGLKPWDYAAGALLIVEAGGMVSAPDGGDTWYESGNIVAGNPKVHAGVLNSIRPHLVDSLRQ